MPETITRWCNEHKLDTPHQDLDTIGLACLPCLGSYFAMHERFAALERKQFLLQAIRNPIVEGSIAALHDMQRELARRMEAAIEDLPAEQHREAAEIADGILRDLGVPRLYHLTPALASMEWNDDDEQPDYGGVTLTHDAVEN